MASTTVEPEIMITFVLLRDPGQAAMARCLIRAALEHRGLGTYADDTTTIASELVTNAFQHATAGIADKIGVTLLHVWNWEESGSWLPTHRLLPRSSATSRPPPRAAGGCLDAAIATWTVSDDSPPLTELLDTAMNSVSPLHSR